MERDKRCVGQATGSCAGCNVMEIGMGLVRWQGLSIFEAKLSVAAAYCPDGMVPQLDKAVNNDASYTMGQRREENLDFEGATKGSRKNRPFGGFTKFSKGSGS